MKFEVRWSQLALSDLLKIDIKNANRITKKVSWFCRQTNPLEFSKSLGGKFQNIHRFRIGDYRALFEIESVEK